MTRRVPPDDEDIAEDTVDEVPLDVPENDAAEQRQDVREPAEQQAEEHGADADERVVDLDEDEYR